MIVLQLLVLRPSSITIRVVVFIATVLNSTGVHCNIPLSQYFSKLARKKVRSGRKRMMLLYLCRRGNLESTGGRAGERGLVCYNGRGSVWIVRLRVSTLRLQLQPVFHCSSLSTRVPGACVRAGHTSLLWPPCDELRGLCAPPLSSEECAPPLSPARGGERKASSKTRDI